MSGVNEAGAIWPLSRGLNSWYRDQERKIDRLLQSVLSTTSTERARPTWQQVHEFVESLRFQQSKASQGKPQEQLLTPAVEKIADAVMAGFVEYQNLGRLRGAASAGSGAARDAMNKNAAAAGAVIVVEVVRLAEQLQSRRAEKESVDEERDRERARIELELNRVGQRAASVALEALDPLIDAARVSIINATAEEVDLLAGLQRTVDELRGHIEAGHRLLGEPK